MRPANLLTAPVLVLVGLVAAACGGGGSDGRPLEVTSEVVSDSTTQDIMVVAPDAEGPWPVVVALHGVDGEGRDMAEIALRLAREGTAVFAPTYRTDLSTQDGVYQAARDIECGYRFVRSIAADHGGDLDQPVTFVGWSLGASAALALGLMEEVDPSGEYVDCFGEVPRPDIVVAISGCYYEYQGEPADLLDVSTLSKRDADVVLVAGEEDTTCAAWQTADAAAELRGAGFDVEGPVVLSGASHYAPVFHDLVDGEWVVVPNDPAGDRTVEIVLDTITRRSANV